MQTGSLEIGAMTMGLVGGLAIFLYGMDLMTSALKTVAGGRMKKMLARMTSNRFKGVLAGAMVTAAIQSSSVTTVLTVGFVAAGLMQLQQAVGIIMGASIGTTITAQIIAFKVTTLALLIVASGFALQFLSENETVKRLGLMIFGLGLIFFGMSLMSDAAAPLREYPPVIELLQKMSNPLLAILLSAAVTALVQSSSATTGIIIVLASQGLINLEQGIALVFGANIGTCVTALLASLGKSRDAKRAALIHISFNVLGVLAWLGFISPMAELIRQLSPVADDLTGMAKLAAETPRQVANAHTLFNVGNTLLFIGFTPWFVSLVTRMVPILPDEKEKKHTPKYLDKLLLDTPGLALDMVRMEAGHLAEHVLPMLSKAPVAAMSGSRSDLASIVRMDHGVDVLHNAIVDYLSEISRRPMSSAEVDLLHGYLAIAKYYELMGDTLKNNLVHLGKTRISKDLQISEETRRLIQELADRIFQQLEQATQAVTRWDREIAVLVDASKMDINESVRTIEHHIVRRMTAEAPHRRSTYQMETELLESLKRIHYFTRHIAKEVKKYSSPKLPAAEAAA